MRVLFVASGNSQDFKIAPFIKSQADSLLMEGISIDYFLIRGRGIIGYIKGVFNLREFLKANKYDLIHAHYVLSGWCAVLGAKKTPVILSLMGSDAFGKYISPTKKEFKSRFSILLTYLIQPFVKRIICKSLFIQSFVYLKNKSSVLPNGINLDVFHPLNIRTYEYLGLDEGKKYILYIGSKKDVWKNYILLEDAVKLLDDPTVEILNPFPVKHEQVPHYINIANVTVLTSFMEGSPNIIKEAMACNCPITATNVGDIAWVIGDTKGCYTSSFDPADFANKLRLSLDFSVQHKKTDGRVRIIELGLDSRSIAQKLICIYQEILLYGI